MKTNDNVSVPLRGAAVWAKWSIYLLNIPHCFANVKNLIMPCRKPHNVLCLCQGPMRLQAADFEHNDRICVLKIKIYVSID